MYYYQSSRRTLRLFRRSDGQMVANFCLSSEATAVASIVAGGGGLRLLVGGADGSVTMLMVTRVQDDHLERSRRMLASLPSRWEKLWRLLIWTHRAFYC